MKIKCILSLFLSLSPKYLSIIFAWMDIPFGIEAATEFHKYSISLPGLCLLFAVVLLNSQ